MKDVIIVGGGPAGNNAALHLSRAGLRVVVVDAREKLGDKLCSGIVGKACVERYPVDPLLIYREASSAKFYAPSGEAIRLVKPGVQAYVIDRVSFVASLAEQAQAVGATYHLGRKVTNLAVTDNGVCATTSGPGGTYDLEAQAAVIASGFGTGLLGPLGLGSVGDTCVGAQVEVSTSGVEEIEVYFGRRLAPGFFGWLVPTTPGRGLAGLMSRRGAGGYLQSLVDKLQSQGKVVETLGPPRRWGIPLRLLNKTYGKRVLVVGDAAGQVKPTTGGGIYYALLSAEIAASSLEEAFAKNDLSASQLKSYETEWKKVLARELRIGYYSRRFFEMMGDRQIDYLLNAISTNGIHEELLNDSAVSFDWHGSFILRAVRHKFRKEVIKSTRSLLETRS